VQIGPYSVLGEIARGGMGVVYRARGPDGQAVALKLLQQVNASARRRFQTEVAALARLRHPHVVSILAAGEHQRQPWLALELVEGESLEQRLLSGPLSIPEAIRIAQQLAQALSYVHSCGVLHRDLKPGNVLWAQGQARLTDFGLARDDDSSLSRITSSGVFQGTPGYWAPEQARGELAVIGPRTDVYGLGAVLYACLTGEPPVRAASLQEFLAAAFSADASPSPRARRPEVPRWLDRLCQRCMALEPDDRPESVDAVARMLVLADAGEARRARGLRGLALALGLALLGAGGAAWAVSRRVPSKETTPPPEVSPSVDPPALSPAARAREESTALSEASGRAFKAGRRKEGLADAYRAVELDPENVEALCNLAGQLGVLERNEEALELIERALAIDPEHPMVLMNRASIRYSQRRYAEVLPDVDRAIELEPRDAAPYFLRGDCLARLGRHGEALADFERGLALDPDDPLALRSYAASLQATGRHALAVETLDRAIALDPQNVELWFGRGASKQLLERYAEAILDYDRALALDANLPRAYYQRAACKASLGRAREALPDFDRSLELDPDDVTVSYSRARARARVGDHTGALADFGRVLAIQPRHAGAWNGRGSSCLRLQRYADALEALNRAIALDPTEAVAYLNRGVACMHLDDYPAALADFESALARDPRSAGAQLNRGVALIELGRYAEAIGALDQALAGELTPETRQEAEAKRAKAVALQRGE